MKHHLGVSVSSCLIYSFTVSRNILLDLQSLWVTLRPIQEHSDAALTRFVEDYQTRAIDDTIQVCCFPGSVAVVRYHRPLEWSFFWNSETLGSSPCAASRLCVARRTCRLPCSALALFDAPLTATSPLSHSICYSFATSYSSGGAVIEISPHPQRRCLTVQWRSCYYPRAFHPAIECYLPFKQFESCFLI